MTATLLPHTDPGNARGRSYSFARAIRSMINGGRLDGLEAEVSAELSRRAERDGRFIDSRHSILVPVSALVSSESRAMTSATALGTTGGDRAWVDSLRGALVTSRLGARLVVGLRHHDGLARFTAGAQAAWVGETEAAPVIDEPSIDGVEFSPRRVVSWIVASNSLLRNIGDSGEAALIGDLTKAIAEAIDRAALTGAGGSEPLGILNNPDVPLVTFGSSSGGPADFATLAGAVTDVASAGADLGRLAIVTSWPGRFSLASTYRDGTNIPLFDEFTGTAAGVPLAATSLVPSDLTAGSGTGLSGLVVGDWSDLLIGYFGDSVALTVDPYSLDVLGLVRIVAHSLVDMALGHPAELWRRAVDLA